MSSRELAYRLAETERRLTAVERASQLSRSSITTSTGEDVPVVEGIERGIAAEATAEAAAGAAFGAQTTADTALTTANGKNKVIHSPDAPSGSGTAPGDIWFRRDGAGVIIGQWEWDGDSWETRTLSDLVIAALDAGKITTGTLAAERIGAKTLTVDKLQVGAFDNLMPNPRYDGNGEGWASMGGGPGTGFVSSPVYGDYALSQKLVQRASGDPTRTLYAAYNQTRPIPVTPGEVLTAYSMVYADGDASISTTVNQRIYFHDKDDVQLSNVSSGFINGSAFPVGAWTRVGGEPLVVPANAVRAYARLTVYMTAGAPTATNFYVGPVTVLRGLAASSLQTGALANGVRIIAGPETGSHTEMTSGGFYAYAEDNVDGVPNIAVRMGTQDNDLFAVTDSNGIPTASISEGGVGSFAKVFSDQDPEILGSPLLGGLATYQSPTEQQDANPGLLDVLPRGVAAWAVLPGGTRYNDRRIPIEVSFEALPGRTYRVNFSGGHTTFHTANASGGYAIVMTLPATIGGEAPSPQFTNYTSLLFSQSSVPTAGMTVTTPGVSKALRCNPGGTAVGGELTPGIVKLGIVCLGDLCNITPSSADKLIVWVEDVGPDLPATGVANGSILGGTQNSPPTVKTYTTTWASTASATYKGNGDKRTDTSDVVQGYNSYNGDGEGLWLFPTSIASTLSGATVKKVEVYAYANHWYYNSGGTALIKVHGYTSAPASNPTMTTAASSASWPKPGGRWVTLPSTFHAGFKSGTYRGFGLGPAGSTNLLYYGRFNGGTGARIRITYTK